VSKPIRVAGALVGDIQRQSDMRIKYGGFFEALGRSCELVEVYDATLHGAAKYWNAFKTFDLTVPRWKQRFFKNVPAFEARSWRARKHFLVMQGRVDVILQLGALFDPTSDDQSLPVVVYTDNTTRITARDPNSDRLAFSPGELQRWLLCEAGLYHRAAHICTRANIVKRSLMDDYDVPADKVSVVGGGVNFAISPDVLGQKAGSAPTLLFIGTDFYRKGGDLVLQAFAKVHKLMPPARLIVVTQDTIPARLPLDGVRVLAPIWNRGGLEALYHQADVFILPSRQETWGDVLLEAMSFGLPCIGVNGQAMEDIIVHEKTGLLVASEQTELLAQAIIQLFEQPDLRHRMGQAARLLVVREFTWDRVVERLFPVLDAIACKLSVPPCFTSQERMSV